MPEDVLLDLRERCRRTWRIPLVRGVGWSRGVDGVYLAALVAYWAAGYDWREHESRLAQLAWILTRGPDPIRAIHRPRLNPREPGSSGLPVVLLHAWPDSVLRFQRLLPQLDDLDVVVPCLPGYPWAPSMTESDMTREGMAQVVGAAPADLGIERYVVSGGDIGSSVAEHLAHQFPDRVAALHLTDVPLRGSVLPRDDILTWVTAYWLTETIGTSLSPYVEAGSRSPAAGVRRPVALAG